MDPVLLLPFCFVVVGAFLAARWADRRQTRERRYLFDTEQRAALAEAGQAIATTEGRLLDMTEQWRTDEASSAARCSADGAAAVQRYLDAVVVLRASVANLTARVPVSNSPDASPDSEPAHLLSRALAAATDGREAAWRYRRGARLEASEHELEQAGLGLRDAGSSLDKETSLMSRLPTARKNRVEVDWSQLKRPGTHR